MENNDIGSNLQKLDKSVKRLIKKAKRKGWSKRKRSRKFLKLHEDFVIENFKKPPRINEAVYNIL